MLKVVVPASEQFDDATYLYDPYKKNGGNGSAERNMKEVEKLPIRPNDYREEDG